jgi:hypothetical protein
MGVALRLDPRNDLVLDRNHRRQQWVGVRLEILQQQLALFAKRLPASPEEHVDQETKSRHEEEGQDPSQGSLGSAIFRDEENDRDQRVHTERDRYHLSQGTHARSLASTA